MCWVGEPPYPDLLTSLHCFICCGAASALLHEQPTCAGRAMLIAISLSRCGTGDSLTHLLTAELERPRGPPVARGC